MGAAKTSVRTSGTMATSTAARRPSCAGRGAARSATATGTARSSRRRTASTVSAEMMNTFTYSAKKKKPKRMPEYSVAKPATISESASVRSNGVRLPSRSRR